MKCHCLLVLCLLATLVAACAKERVYGNLYEGLRKRDELVNPGNGPDTAASQGYDAYQRERARTLTKEE
jgi:hypothetical protein